MTRKFYVLEPLEPERATEHYASFDRRTGESTSGERPATVYRYKKPASEHSTAIHVEADGRGGFSATPIYWTSISDTRPQERDTSTFAVVDTNNPLIMIRQKGNRACSPIADADIKANAGNPAMDEKELDARKMAIVGCLKDMPGDLQPSGIEGMVRRDEGVAARR